MPLRPRLVDRWNDGSLDVDGLLSAVRRMLPGYVTSATLALADMEFDRSLAEELQRRRVSGEHFSSSMAVLRLAADVLTRLCRSRAISVPADIQDLASTPDRPRPAPLDYADSSRFVAFRSSDVGLKSIDLIIPSEADRERLREELSSLGIFAILPDHLVDSEIALARLLALRIFGGLSLEELANREGRPLEIIKHQWQHVHDWITAASKPAASFASSAFLDVLDYHVLRAIAKRPDLLHALEWRTFERILAGVLEELGYTIELRRGTKDGGIDVIAVRTADNFGGHRYLIQAKRWRKRVGVQPVRELLFLKERIGATKVCLATTSHFTKGAWKLADEYRWELELRDFERLQEWLTLAAASKRE